MASNLFSSEKLELLNDPLFIDFGNMLPVLHPPQYPSVLTSVSENFFKQTAFLKLTFFFVTWLLRHKFLLFHSIVPLITMFLVPRVNFPNSNIDSKKTKTLLSPIQYQNLHMLILLQTEVIMYLQVESNFTIKHIKLPSNRNSLTIFIKIVITPLHPHNAVFIK